MSQKKTNQPEYGTELKLAAVRRVLAGESVSAVAQELGIRRKRLYVWKDRYAELGEGANRPPRPRPHSPVYNLFRKKTVPSFFVSRQGCTPTVCPHVSPSSLLTCPLLSFT